MMVSLLQLPGLFGENPTFYFLLFYLPFLLFLLYGQKIQTWMILNDVARSLNKLKVMREKARKEAIEYISETLKPPQDPTERVDQFLEYFTIMPVDLDPSGVVKKIEHILTTRDERIRSEVRSLASKGGSVETSAAENILEAATALNLIYKVVRHY